LTVNLYISSDVQMISGFLKHKLLLSYIEWWFFQISAKIWQSMLVTDVGDQLCWWKKCWWRFWMATPGTTVVRPPLKRYHQQRNSVTKLKSLTLRCHQHQCHRKIPAKFPMFKHFATKSPCDSLEQLQFRWLKTIEIIIDNAMSITIFLTI